MRKLISTFLFSLIIICSFASAVPSTSDFDEWFTFDDGYVTGTTIIGSVGNYNCTGVNTPTYNSSRIAVNYSIDFAAANTEYLDCGANGILTGDYTIGCWVEGRSKSIHEFFFGRFDGGVHKGFALRYSSDETFVYYHVVQGTDEGGLLYNSITTSNSYTSGNNLVIASFEVGVGSKLYVNGKFEGSDNTRTDAITDFTPDLWIGARDGSTKYPADGMLDECFLMKSTISDGGNCSVAGQYCGGDIEYLWNDGTPTTLQQYPFGAGAETAPVISNIVCTSPDPDDSTEPYTTGDTTPTFTLSTDVNSNCGISNENASYIACETTGTTSHICTLDSSDTLNESTDYVYINCTNTADSSKETSEQLTMDIIPNGTGNCDCPTYGSNFILQADWNCNITTDCNIGPGIFNVTGTGSSTENITTINATITCSKVSLNWLDPVYIIMYSNSYINNSG